MSQNPVTRREQLRLQQEAAAKRQRQMRIIGVASAVLALGLIAVVVGYLINQNHNKSTVAASQAIPVNANADHTGIVVPGTTAAKAGAPTLVEYQDYQCPACKQYYDIYGKIIDSLVNKGELNLEYRTMTFLDVNLRNDASTRAAVAAACADNVGAYQKYHDAIYANQPAQEGVGYTDQQLRVTFAAQAGISGDLLTKFQQCYDARATSKFVTGVDDAAGKANVTSTPTYRVNGKDFKLSSVNPTEAEVLAAIKAAAQG